MDSEDPNQEVRLRIIDKCSSSQADIDKDLEVSLEQRHVGGHEIERHFNDFLLSMLHVAYLCILFGHNRIVPYGYFVSEATPVAIHIWKPGTAIELTNGMLLRSLVKLQNNHLEPKPRQHFNFIIKFKERVIATGSTLERSDVLRVVPWQLKQPLWNLHDAPNSLVSLRCSPREVQGIDEPLDSLVFSAEDDSDAEIRARIVRRPAHAAAAARRRGRDFVQDHRAGPAIALLLKTMLRISSLQARGYVRVQTKDNHFEKLGDGWRIFLTTYSEDPKRVPLWQMAQAVWYMGRIWSQNKNGNEIAHYFNCLPAKHHGRLIASAELQLGRIPI